MSYIYLNINHEFHLLPVTHTIYFITNKKKFQGFPSFSLLKDMVGIKELRH